jgi:hypothetical protein
MPNYGFYGFQPQMKPAKRPRGMTPVRSKPEGAIPPERSSAYRENTERMTLSMPRGLPDIVRPICKALDLEYSKVFRRGLDLFVEENKQKISPRLYASYQVLRRSAEHWE